MLGAPAGCNHGLMQSLDVSLRSMLTLVSMSRLHNSEEKDVKHRPGVGRGVSRVSIAMLKHGLEDRILAAREWPVCVAIPDFCKPPFLGLIGSATKPPPLGLDSAGRPAGS